MQYFSDFLSGCLGVIFVKLSMNQTLIKIYQNRAGENGYSKLIPETKKAAIRYTELLVLLKIRTSVVCFSFRRVVRKIDKKSELSAEFPD